MFRRSDPRLGCWLDEDELGPAGLPRPQPRYGVSLHSQNYYQINDLLLTDIDLAININRNIQDVLKMISDVLINNGLEMNGGVGGEGSNAPRRLNGRV